MPVEEGKKKRRKLNADPSPQALWVETQRATLCAKREGGAPGVLHVVDVWDACEPMSTARNGCATGGSGRAEC
jgi:hypothetical protein